MKGIITLIILTIIICLLFNSNANKKLKAQYSLGEAEGYKIGYSEIEKAYKPKIEEQRLAFEQRIDTQKKTYEKKINVSYNDGFEKGKKQKQQEVENSLQEKSTEKQNKGQWNDILFDVNN